jgi:hypothetical protein
MKSLYLGGRLFLMPLVFLATTSWATVSCDSSSNPTAPECRRGTIGTGNPDAAALQGVASAIANALAQQGGQQDLESERVRAAQETQQAQSRASALVDQMASRPETNPWAQMSNSNAAAEKASAGLPSLPTLSSDCGTAQQQGMTFAREISRSATAQGPSVCQSARAHRLLGQLQMKVARRCQSIPTWQELQRAGQRMVDDADRTIAGSCQ